MTRVANNIHVKAFPILLIFWDSRSITFSCRVIWCAPIEMHILSKKSLFGELFLFVKHMSNMEVDLQSLFGLNVTWCAQLLSLAETPLLPSSPSIWTRVTRALLVSKDRRHLFVTPCCKGTACSILSGKGKSFFEIGKQCQSPQCETTTQ
jgi:hypothetical protein